MYNNVLPCIITFKINCRKKRATDKCQQPETYANLPLQSISAHTWTIAHHQQIPFV